MAVLTPSYQYCFSCVVPTYAFVKGLSLSLIPFQSSINALLVKLGLVVEARYSLNMVLGKHRAVEP